MGKLTMMHLAVLLEDKGNEMDPAREAEMKVEACQMIVEGWNAWNGLGMWEETCADYHSMMEKKDTEDLQEILGALEAKERLELEAERDIDLTRMDKDMEI